MNIKIALVTGAYGFLGRHVTRKLSNLGYYVIGMGHGSWGRGEWRAWGLDEWHGVDINLNNLVTYAKAPDVVIHCAGSGSVAFSVENPQLDFNRTVVATSQLLDFIRLHSPKASLVYPSSAAVYGANPQIPTDESATLNPLSPYGVHKMLAEELCKMYSVNFGLKISIVRLFSVYGSELRKQLLWDASHKLQRGVRDFPGTGYEARDLVHVDDASSLMYYAVKHAATRCAIVNGGHGNSITVKQILQVLMTEFGLTGELHFTGEKRVGDPATLVANSKLSGSWGWKATKDWKEGIGEYAKWFKNNS